MSDQSIFQPLWVYISIPVTMVLHGVLVAVYRQHRWLLWSTIALAIALLALFIAYMTIDGAPKNICGACLGLACFIYTLVIEVCLFVT